MSSPGTTLRDTIVERRQDIMRGVKAKRKQFNDTQDEYKEQPWVGTRNP